MRPGSGLMRPPSAKRPQTPSAAHVHAIAHNLRSRISLHRHVVGLPDAPPVSEDVRDLTGESDEAFFALLRNREDTLRTQLFEIARGSPSSSAPALLSLDSGCVVRALVHSDRSEYIAEVWRDEDGVLIEDCPKILRLFPDPTSLKRFAEGVLVASSLSASGVWVPHFGIAPTGLHNPIALHRVRVADLLRNNASLRLDLRSQCKSLVRPEPLRSLSPTKDPLSAMTAPSPSRSTRTPVDAPSASNDTVEVERYFAPETRVALNESGECLAVLMDRRLTKAVTARRDVRRPTASTRLMTLATEPFTDADVFQWFYLQLSLKMLLDAHLDPAMYGGANDEPLRVDGIAKCDGGSQSLAFGVPARPGGSVAGGSAGEAFVIFPPHTPRLNILWLDAVVLPAEAVDTERCLLGALRQGDMPCVSKFGRFVQQWASAIRLRTPLDAWKAMQQLFDLYQTAFAPSGYVVERAEVLEMPVAPQICTCDVRRSLRRLQRHAWISGRAAAAAAVLGGLTPTGEETTKRSVSLAPHPPPLVAPVATAEATPSRDDKIDVRWRQYMSSLNVDVFSKDVDAVAPLLTLETVLGRGGSGVVFRGQLRDADSGTSMAVAVKCFVYPDSAADHSGYVRECLTDVAFFSVHTALVDAGILPAVRCYDFFVSGRLAGIDDASWKTCLHHHPSPASARLCYLVSDLASGTVGRFMTPDDDDYDACYDQLINAPLTDMQVFMFLYSQLVMRAGWSYVMHDLMLTGQLRGDNVGFIPLSSLQKAAVYASGGRLQDTKLKIPSGENFVYVVVDESAVSSLHSEALSTSPSTTKILRFPIADPAVEALAIVIDVGQGQMPALEAHFTKRAAFGCPTVESCLIDDGMGRYWPSDALYAKDIAASGRHGKALLQWAAVQSVASPAAAATALHGLLEMAFAAFGCPDLTKRDDLKSAYMTFQLDATSLSRARTAIRQNFPPI